MIDLLVLVVLDLVAVAGGGWFFRGLFADIVSVVPPRRRFGIRFLLIHRRSGKCALAAAMQDAWRWLSHCGNHPVGSQRTVHHGTG